MMSSSMSSAGNLAQSVAERLAVFAIAKLFFVTAVEGVVTQHPGGTFRFGCKPQLGQLDSSMDRLSALERIQSVPSQVIQFWASTPHGIVQSSALRKRVAHQRLAESSCVYPTCVPRIRFPLSRGTQKRMRQRGDV